MSRMLTLACLAVLILPAAVAAQDTTKTPPKIKRNPDLISKQEIQAAPDAWTTAFDLVRQLRPNWLRQRGPSSILSATPVVQVYVAGMNRGGPEELETVTRSSVQEILHLNGTDATLRYGTGHESGAILIILK